MSPTLQIVHTPTGRDHPYQVLPTERMPRDPVGGDMVSLGFVTRPGQLARTVTVHWTRNGRPQTPIGARPDLRGTDEDRWLVELGVVEGGDVVEYWIEAAGEGQTARTAPERFRARRWRRLAGIAGQEQIDGGHRLRTIGDDQAPGPELTLIQGAQPGTVRVHVAGQIGTASDSVNANAESPIELANDPIGVRIDPATGRLTLITGRADEPSLSLRWLEGAAGRVLAVELTSSLDAAEVLTGFGERFDALDQHGRAPDTVVYEQYKNQGNRTYLPVPFFVSNGGYGCLVEGTSPVSYDLGRTVHDRWRLLADVPERRAAGFGMTLFGGKPLDILHAFTALTGRPHTPPAWAFGPWMSSNEWNTQARVLHEVAATEEHGILATALVIEAWSDETTFYIWNGARYTPTSGGDAPRLADFAFPPDGPWPDPQEMIDRLHDAGIRVLLWQIPALKQIDTPHAQHDADVSHAVEQGYVLRDADDEPYRNPAFWFNGALIPDWTSAEATRWWLGKRQYLLDELGIDGFKTDGGEHLQGRGLQSHDGRRGDELVNAYPNLYIGAYHRFVWERKHGDALTFSRAGHTGAGAFAAHWAGDENSTWEAYRRSVVAGLTAAMSGVPFWGWDIAGFSEALPSAELYLRATAMAAFCPIMQYHSEYNPSGPSRDRTPWNVQRHTGDERIIPLARFFARLRMNLLPYIVSEAAHCAASGEPLMRPLLLDDPDDPTAWRIADQYRFGRDLLVAPIMDEGATGRRLYLPAGTWHDLWNGEAIAGGRWIEVEVPLKHIPIFVRAGAILSLNLGASGTLGDDVGNAVDRYHTLSFWLYPQGRSSAIWIDARGHQHTIRMAASDHGRVEVELPLLPADCTLRLPEGSVRAVPSSAEPHVISL